MAIGDSYRIQDMAIGDSYRIQARPPYPAADSENSVAVPNYSRNSVAVPNYSRLLLPLPFLLLALLAGGLAVAQAPPTLAEAQREAAAARQRSERLESQARRATGEAAPGQCRGGRPRRPDRGGGGRHHRRPVADRPDRAPQRRPARPARRRPGLADPAHRGAPDDGAAAAGAGAGPARLARRGGPRPGPARLVAAGDPRPHRRRPRRDGARAEAAPRGGRGGGSAERRPPRPAAAPSRPGPLRARPALALGHADAVRRPGIRSRPRFRRGGARARRARRHPRLPGPPRPPPRRPARSGAAPRRPAARPRRRSATCFPSRAASSPAPARFPTPGSMPAA